MARYDGLAEWYERQLTGPLCDVTRISIEMLVSLLGPGPGRCLDLGCGTGIAVPHLTASDWAVTGIDASRDQLRLARDRIGAGTELLQGDATNLPFDDGNFDAIVARFVHNDVDDFAAVASEIARVLRPGGRFVHVGMHPCFDGHFVEVRDEGRLIHRGYWERARKRNGVGIRPGGIRSRVGARDIPLSDFLNAVLLADLMLERVEEPTAEDPPTVLGISARKPA